MAKLGISTGTTPNDGTGDNLLAGAVKINSNFNEIYTRFGDGTNLTSIGGTWTLTSVGIHTLKNVGIGTTNPRFALEVGAVGASGTTLFVNGNARVTGILTIGTASITLNGATNIINVGTGITINGSTGIISATSIVLGGTTLTGTAVTSITAGSGISVNQSTGNVTITATGGGGSSQWVTTVAGIHTLSNVGIGTTNPTSALTVTGNGTFTGVVTATTFVGALTGTATTATNAQGLTGTPNITVGVATASALKVAYGTTAATIEFGQSGILQYSQPNVTLSSSYSSGKVILTAESGIEMSRNNETVAYFAMNPSNIGYVELYYDNSKKFQTIGDGVSITGTTFTNNLSVSGIASVGTGITMYGSTGIISATTFVGNFSGSITNATNLTGGYANASQLNVSGVATISQGRIQADGSSNLRFGNIAAGSGSGRNIAIGDQVLYSLSSGQGRNIGIGELSYYDTTSGQYNIGLGIQAGQKITTGNYNVILGGYDGQTGLDIRTSSNNVVIADGQGNIRQYINSSGNVGIKTTVITEALTVAGIVSATSFYGTLNAGQLTGSLPAINGSALIGVVGSGSGIIIQENGTPVGTAGTINFGSNINVTFASGIATVSGASSVTSATTAYGLAGTPNLNVGVITATSFVGNLTGTASLATVAGIATYTSEWILGAVGNSDYTFTGPGLIGAESDPVLYLVRGQQYKFTNIMGMHPFRIQSTVNGSTGTAYNEGITNNDVSNGTLTWNVQFDAPNILYYQCTAHAGMGGKIYIIDAGIGPDISINTTGIITASSFSGSGSGLTNLPAAQLTGTLPAIDGSALLNVTAAGTGVAIRDDNSNIGSATTINFGTGLDATFSAGIATITASGGSLQSRTTVSGVTTSIANNGIGNTNITGFKSYGLMKVGLSTAGWLRLYTDSTSRANDISRSVGTDPAPGSGVIAEVVTTGITTTQIISPFVMGGNLDNSPTTTIYAAITNLSGITQAITANLTILQLEA